MKKQATWVLAICLSIFAIAIPGTANAWGPDVVVNPEPGRYYSAAKVSVSYDGTIYYGRLYSTISADGPMRDLEILKSTNNGLTFSNCLSFSLSAAEHFTCFDIMAAGNEESTFALFISRTSVDTVLHNSTLLCSRHNASGGSLLLVNESFSSERGWCCVSLASDYRNKNYASDPYAVSMAAVKNGVLIDSVIVWTDEVGGYNLNRVSLHGASADIRSVGIAIGSVTSETSVYGRLGVVWDYFQLPSDDYGGLAVMFVYPNTGGLPYYAGPYDVGFGNSSYRNPSMAVSQKTSNGTGFGEGDMRTLIVAEHSSGAIYGYVCDSIVHAMPNPSKYEFVLASDITSNKNPYVVYDPINEQFDMTYFNASDNWIPFKYKELGAPGYSVALVMVESVRDADTYCDYPVVPRIDLNIKNKKVVIAWSDNGLSMFDAENSTNSYEEIATNQHGLVTIFPNPASDIVMMNFKIATAQVMTISMIDIQGKIVKSEVIEARSGDITVTVPTSELPSGEYVLLIEGADFVVSECLLIAE